MKAAEIPKFSEMIIWKEGYQSSIVEEIQVTAEDLSDYGAPIEFTISLFIII